MKNSIYKSVPVIASIIGSKSRKAMYLTNVTSLDGKRIYKDKWIPTSWSNNSSIEIRYTNKEKGIDNQVVHAGKYYKFHFKDSVLLTEKGAVNTFGAKLDVDGLKINKVSSSRQTVQWEHHSQSLVEFPMSKVSESMIIDTHNTRNVSTIKSKLINGKVKEYYQLEDRYIIHIPTWLIRNFEERYTKKEIQTELFSNDNDFETVIERTEYDSKLQEQFSYIDRTEMNFETIDCLTQWEIDNPEYV
ncbi:MAG: hypothetical protein ABF260_04355 [Flavobacteriaceae bacterium]